MARPLVRELVTRDAGRRPARPRRSPRPTRRSAGRRRPPRSSSHRGAEALAELQKRLFAERRAALLLVLQAMDAGGKDGTIRTVMTGSTRPASTSPASACRASEEPQHDYLWRVHAARARARADRRVQPQPLRGRARGAGQGARARKVWRQRYGHIRDFERMLGDEGTHGRQAVPQHVEGGAAPAPAGPRRRPDERWKFRARRPRRPGAVADVPGRRTSDALRADVDRRGAVVRRAGRPQVGAQPGRRQDPAATTSSASTRSTPSPRTASRASSSSDAIDRTASHADRTLVA